MCICIIQQSLSFANKMIPVIGFFIVLIIVLAYEVYLAIKNDRKQKQSEQKAEEMVYQSQMNVQYNDVDHNPEQEEILSYGMWEKSERSQRGDLFKGSKKVKQNSDDVQDQNDQRRYQILDILDSNASETGNQIQNFAKYSERDGKKPKISALKVLPLKQKIMSKSQRNSIKSIDQDENQEISDGLTSHKINDRNYIDNQDKISPGKNAKFIGTGSQDRLKKKIKKESDLLVQERKNNLDQIFSDTKPMQQLSQSMTPNLIQQDSNTHEKSESHDKKEYSKPSDNQLKVQMPESPKKCASAVDKSGNQVRQQGSKYSNEFNLGNKDRLLLKYDTPDSSQFPDVPFNKLPSIQKEVQQNNMIKKLQKILNSEEPSEIKTFFNKKLLSKVQQQKNKQSLQKQSESITNKQVNESKQTNQLIRKLQKANQQLQEQLQFCKFALSQAIQAQEKIKNQQKATNMNEQLSQLRVEVSRMRPIVDQFQNLNQRYLKLKAQQEERKGSYIQMDTKRVRWQSKRPSEISDVSRKSDYYSENIVPNRISQLTSATVHHRFLNDCNFLKLTDKQFLYGALQRVERGVYDSQKIYDSIEDTRNPVTMIDKKQKILLIIQLENRKVIGAFSNVGFDSCSRGPVVDRDSLLLDISNKKYFINFSGKNAIQNHPDKLVWGMNEILINVTEKDILFSNFGKTRNVFWDGRYSSNQFMGSYEQWARIRQFIIFQIIRLY